MSKTKKTKTESPEITQQQAYVQTLKEKGAVVLIGRSQGELEEKLSAIPTDINIYTSPVSHYIDKGLFRVQVNLKED